MPGGRSNNNGPPGKKEAPDVNRDIISGLCVIPKVNQSMWYVSEVIKLRAAMLPHPALKSSYEMTRMAGWETLMVVLKP